MGELLPDPTLLHKPLLVYLSFSISSPIQAMDKGATFDLTWVLQRTTFKFHTPPLPHIGIGTLPSSDQLSES